MRLLYTLVFSFIFSTVLSAQWEFVNHVEGGQVNHLKKVDNTVYAGTAQGLYRSDDDGYTWTREAAIPADYFVERIWVQGTLVYVVATAPVAAGDTLRRYYLFYTSFSGAWNTQLVVEAPLSSYQELSGRVWYHSPYWYYACAAGLYRKFLSLQDTEPWVRVSDKNYFTASATRLWAYDGYKIAWSDDDGDSWTEKPCPYAAYDLWAKNDRILLLTHNRICYSDDNAATWTVAYQGTGLGSIISVTQTGELYVGRNNFFLRSTDDGTSWETMNYAGNSLFDVITVEAADSGLLAGSFNGIHRIPPGSTVPEFSMAGLNTGSADFLQAAGDTLLLRSQSVYRVSGHSGLPFSQWQVAAPIGVVRGGVYGNKLYRVAWKLEYSTDLGQSWSPAYQDLGQYSEGFLIKNDKIYVSNWDFMVRLDAHTHAVEDTMPMPEFFGVFDLETIGDALILSLPEQGRIYRSIDQGQSWSLVKSDWSGGYAGWPDLTTSIGNRFFAVSHDGILASDDLGAQFFPLYNGLPVDPATGATRRVATLSRIENQLYAVVPGSGVFLSTDLGEHWSPVTDGLPTSRVKLGYANRRTLYLSTEDKGLWRLPVDLESAKGLVFLDANQNGQRDAGEKPFPGAVLQARPTGFYAASGADGRFTLLKPPGADSLYIASTLPFVHFVPEWQLAEGGVVGLEYAAQLESGYQDLCLSLTAVTIFRPGFQNTLMLSVLNNGSEPVAPVVKLFSLGALEYQGANPPPDISSADSLVWVLPELAPLSAVQLAVQVRTPVDAELGSIISLQARVEPLAGDIHTGNNTARMTDRVVGSFDPNDKRVQPEFLDALSVSDSSVLDYTIRFQNTGTWPAEFVRITDTLSDWLDPASIRILGHSHPMRWNLLGSNVLEFFFDDIQLPDSLSDEPGSHGFVRFQARLRAAPALGDTVSNTAYIYFDYNPPIVTNAAESPVTLTTRVLHPETADRLRVYPNPAQDRLWLEPAPEGPVRVYDAEGREVLVRARAWQAPLDVSGLPEGVYRIVVQGQNRNSSGSFQILRR